MMQMIVSTAASGAYCSLAWGSKGLRVPAFIVSTAVLGR